MTGPGLARPLGGWQRASVLAAAQYMVRRLRDEPDDLRARVICEGLLDVLDPAGSRGQDGTAEPARVRLWQVPNGGNVSGGPGATGASRSVPDAPSRTRFYPADRPMTCVSEDWWWLAEQGRS